MKKIFISVLVIVITLSISIFSIGASGGFGGDKYKVTVTNITQGQIMSPIVVATHRNIPNPLFTLGAPASSELAKVAEDADTADLVAALEANAKVQ